MGLLPDLELQVVDVLPVVLAEALPFAAAAASSLDAAGVGFEMSIATVAIAGSGVLLSCVRGKVSARMQKWWVC